MERQDQDQDQDQNQDQDKTQARPSHISRKFVKPQQRNVENINPKPQNVAKNYITYQVENQQQQQQQ